MASFAAEAQQIAQDHVDAWLVSTFGARESGLPEERVADLIARGLVEPKDRAGLVVPESRHKVDPWTFLYAMAPVYSAASPERRKVMQGWSVGDWAPHVDRYIDQATKQAEEREQSQQVLPPAKPPRRKVTAERPAALPPRTQAAAAPTPAPVLPAPPPSAPTASGGPPEPRKTIPAPAPSEPVAIDIIDTRPSKPLPKPAAAALPAPAPAPDPPAPVEPKPPAPPRPPETPPAPKPPPEAKPTLAVIPAPPRHLTEVEREAWIQARTRAGEYARGLGNRVVDEVGTILEHWSGEEITKEVDAEKRRRVLGIIREEVAATIADGRSTRDLASNLGHRTKNWAHNWRRIAETELQGAMNEGVVITAIRNEGSGARIARIPEPDACPSCTKLFLDDGKPIIWDVAKLIANGTNVGRKRSEWVATIWPIHPHCRCGTEEVPPGFEFDDEWSMVPRNAENA